MSAGTETVASLTISREKGASEITERILNAVCTAAMPHQVSTGCARKGISTSDVTTRYTISQKSADRTLKYRWTRAVRRAFLFAPIEESIAVTQVPIFRPMMIGIDVP